MRTLDERAVNDFIQSYPVKVRFAGFESDTLTLARAGWDLSIEQRTLMAWGSMSMRLAMRLGDRENAIYAISSAQPIDDSAVYAALHSAGGLVAFMKNHLYFHIAHISQNMMFQIHPELAQSSRSRSMQRDQA